MGSLVGSTVAVAVGFGVLVVLVSGFSPLAAESTSVASTSGTSATESSVVSAVGVAVAIGVSAPSSAFAVDDMPTMAITMNTAIRQANSLLNLSFIFSPFQGIWC